MDVFYDLDVPHNAQNLLKIIDELVENKFYFIAISKTISLDYFNNEKISDNPADPTGPKKTMKSKSERQQMRTFISKELAPPNISTFISPKAKRIAEIHGKQVRLLTRINIHFDSASENNINLFFREYANNLNLFDIVSATPTTSAQFGMKFMSSSIDLISINLNKSNDREMQFSGKHLRNLWKTRNVFTEIKISPLLHCPAAKPACVYFFTELKRTRCEEALVISSGALTEWDVRSGFGIACLARAFGMKPHLAMHTISRNPQKVFEQSLVRKNTAFGAMAIIKLSKLGGVVSVESLKASDDSSTERSSQEETFKRKSNTINSSCELSDNTPFKKQKRNFH